jgi:hypothetical protein
MVDRIELTRSTPQGCDVETIRNVPPPAYSRAGGPLEADYVRDGDTLSTYVTFLRVSALVYSLQKNGHLLLRGNTVFVPYSEKAALEEPPKAADMATASAKNAIWEKVADKKWLLGEKVFSPVFYLNPLIQKGGQLVADTNAITKELLDHHDIDELKNGPALAQVLAILSSGFSVAGAPTAQTTDSEPCPTGAGSGITSHLVMRSLMGMMAAAAQEQTAFDIMAQKDPMVPPNPRLPKDQQDSRKFSLSVPQVERLPLLRLNWSGEKAGTPPLVSLNYRGKNYLVSDAVSPDVPENQYWNRDVFRLINQLAAQVTVDISKFPLPEILQLRTQ